VLSAAELKTRARGALSRLHGCTLCPRKCGVDRQRGEKGFCGCGRSLRVAAVSVHHGEEPPLSGTGGSGNVFFTGCSLSCLFCQNYPVSRLGVGREITPGELAEDFLSLQERGAHNVNLVSPAPWVPHILEALCLAKRKGFHLPVVYNSSGYESRDTLRLLDGVVDIYLPDMKYATRATARLYSAAPGYVSVNRRAVAEMARQVGPLSLVEEEAATRGVLVRHLVLPGGTTETVSVLRYLERAFPQLPVSLMYQYFPAFQAVGRADIGRRLWRQECRAVERFLKEMSSREGWTQEYG
jgi:putative pyruvate formate lyase activating enzyme